VAFFASLGLSTALLAWARHRRYPGRFARCAGIPRTTRRLGLFSDTAAFDMQIERDAAAVAAADALAEEFQV